MNLSDLSVSLVILPGDLSGTAGLLSVVGLFLLISWLVCVAAAICQVEQVQITVGMMAIGSSLLVAFLLMGLCRTFLPNVAASFTKDGLFLVSAVAGALICSVPLVQYSWHLSYLRGMVVLCGAFVLLFGSLAAIHGVLGTMEELQDQVSVKMFVDHQPGLSE